MKQPLYHSIILKSDDMILTLYQGKPSNNILILSTMHRSVDRTEKEKNKLPESVIYYNNTIINVDNVDQLPRLYNSKVSYRSWPVQVFYNLLDLLAVINQLGCYMS